MGVKRLGWIWIWVGRGGEAYVKEIERGVSFAGEGGIVEEWVDAAYSADISELGLLVGGSL